MERLSRIAEVTRPGDIVAFLAACAQNADRLGDRRSALTLRLTAKFLAMALPVTWRRVGSD